MRAWGVLVIYIALIAVVVWFVWQNRASERIISTVLPIPTAALIGILVFLVFAQAENGSSGKSVGEFGAIGFFKKTIRKGNILLEDLSLWARTEAVCFVTKGGICGRRPASVLVPGSALGSVPTVALSSARATEL
jgi:hypothetical protein